MTKQASAEKKRLLGEKAQVEQELENLRAAMLNEVDVEPDEGDAEIFEREKTAALITVLERRLQGIEHAIRAIDKGQYGICERCGNPIEPGRLEVKPDAILCLTCQREVETIKKRGRVMRSSTNRWP